MFRTRLAAALDAPVVATIQVASWQAAYGGLLPDSLLDSMSVQDRTMAWKGLLGRGCTVHVADQDDCPVGFVAAGPSRDPEAPAGRGEIYALYVLPAAWGTGVGKALHNEALVHLQATGLAEATLWVLDGNLRARTFYARQGWAPDGTVKTEVVSTVPLLELRYRRALYA